MNEDILPAIKPRNVKFPTNVNATPDSKPQINNICRLIELEFIPSDFATE